MHFFKFLSRGIRSTIHLKIGYMLAFGLAVRLILAPFTAHPFDVYNRYHLSMGILKDGPFAHADLPMLYYTMIPVSYFYGFLSSILGSHVTCVSALSPILVGAMGWAVPQGVNIPVITDLLYNLVVKTPMIISDTLTGLLLFMLVRNFYGVDKGNRAFTLWYLNPVLIWVSAVWGMYDSLPAFFSILSLFLILKKRVFLSGTCLAVAFAYKLYPAMLIVPLLIWAFRKSLKRDGIILFASFLGFSILLCAPFILQIRFVLEETFRINNGNPSTHPWTTFGLTYWSIAPFLPLDGITVGLISNILLVTLTIGVAVLAILKFTANTATQLFYWQLLAISPIFLACRVVTEQWFIWILPFLIMLYASDVYKKVGVTGLSLLALTYSWVNSQFIAFFAPAYQLASSFFEEMVTLQGTLGLASARLLMMGALGVAFTLCLLIMVVRSGFKVST